MKLQTISKGKLLHRSLSVHDDESFNQWNGKSAESAFNMLFPDGILQFNNVPTGIL